MTLQDVPLGLYGVLIVFYSYVLSPVGLLLAWKGTRYACLWLWEKMSRAGGAKQPDRLPRRLPRQRVAESLAGSLLFNVILAVGSTVGAFAILAECPLTVQTKLAVASLTAAVIPYVWGFCTTASVGNYSGMFGVLLGLAWLSYRSAEIVWVDHVGYFLAVNLVAQSSGWLGAVVGQGQTRESVVVSVFLVEGPPWRELWRSMKRAIRRGVSETNPELFAQMAEVEKPVREVVADWGTTSSVVEYSRLVEWRGRSCPHLRLWGWFRSIDTHSVDEILDRATCLLSLLIVKAQINAARGAPTEAPRAEVQVLIFLETSTIIYTDDLCAQLGTATHARVRRALRRVGGTSTQSAHAIVRKWEGKPNIEQNAKRTMAVTLQGQTESGEAVSTAQPSHLLAKAIATETWFDRFRGKRVTFVVVLVIQVVWGLAVDWASNRLVGQ